MQSALEIQQRDLFASLPTKCQVSVINRHCINLIPKKTTKTEIIKTNINKSSLHLRITLLAYIFLQLNLDLHNKLIHF